MPRPWAWFVPTPPMYGIGLRPLLGVAYASNPELGLLGRTGVWGWTKLAWGGQGSELEGQGGGWCRGLEGVKGRGLEDGQDWGG